MGLHIGPFGTEKLLEALDSDALALIHHLAAAVIAVAGITLGILVGQTRAHGTHHLVTDEIFGCDKLDPFLLALMFALDNVKNHFVFFHKLEDICI